MSKWLGDFRLLPIVLIAVACLFALKTTGIVLDGGYTLGQRLGARDTLVVTTVPASQIMEMQSPAVPLDIAAGQPAAPKLSWMQEMFNYPDITGSVAAKPKEPPKDAAKEAGKEPPKGTSPPETKAAGGTTAEPQRLPSAGERALLERLQERRLELDKRARELDMREGMLKAAEKKADTAGPAVKADGAGSGPAGGPAGGAVAEAKAEDDNPRFKAVVTMYETMKPKDAAKIFDRLDMKVLLDVASKINPRRMSEILSQMTPEAAERLTVELASRGPVDRMMNPSNLPKIEGRPTGG